MLCSHDVLSEGLSPEFGILLQRVYFRTDGLHQASRRLTGGMDGTISRTVFDSVMDTWPTIGPSALSAAEAPERNERQQRLHDGIIFSRRFIPAYNIILAVVLLCFTLRHWYGKTRQRRARQAKPCTEDNIEANNDTGKTVLVREEERDGTSSSGSSTLSPSRAEAKSTKSENTPLLESNVRRYSTTRGRPSRALQSWLMYQPAPIPIINKTLPSNNTSLAIVLFLALNVFFSFYKAVPTVPTAFIFADRVGLLFVANLPILYLFAAKNAPLRRMTGYSYENLNIFHRRIGELMCLLALFHAAGMIVVWYTTLRPLGVDFWRLLSIKLIWLGCGALAAYELLYLTSLGSFRQRFYEVFLASHVLLQVVGLSFLWFHHPGTRPYVGFALAIFLLDRLIFRLGLTTKIFQADLTVLEDGETVLVSADWQKTNPTRIWRLLSGGDLRSGWAPTEHAFMTVPALSKKHVVQAHPFTIASAAPTHKDAHVWMSLIIRAHDGFSGDLLRYAKSHQTAAVRLDGPYGSMHALEMLHASDVAVVVAGGSGIAVAFPLLWSLLMQNTTSTGQAQRKRDVFLIWVVHDGSHIDWIGQERLDELRERGLKTILPAPTNRAGRPDVAELVEGAVEDACAKDQNLRIGAVVSGPDGMNRTVRNTCATMVGQGRRVDVAVEKFGW